MTYVKLVIAVLRKASFMGAFFFAAIDPKLRSHFVLFDSAH